MYCKQKSMLKQAILSENLATVIAALGKENDFWILYKKII
jgi:hypothetical protein